MHLAGGRRKNLRPKFEPEARSSFYELTEKRACLFDFSFYVPSWSGSPGSGSKVTLSYDDKAFLTTAKEIYAVESRYDEQAWLVIPGPTEGEVIRELVFKTSVKVPAGTNAEPVDLALTIPVKITRAKLRRFLSSSGAFVGAVGLAVGTIALALISHPPFGLAVEVLAVAAVVGYAVWLVISAFARGWKP